MMFGGEGLAGGDGRAVGRWRGLGWERVGVGVHDDGGRLVGGELGRRGVEREGARDVGAVVDDVDVEDARVGAAASLGPRREGVGERRARGLGERADQARRVDIDEVDPRPRRLVGADDHAQVVVAGSRAIASSIATRGSGADDDQRRRVGVGLESDQLVRRRQVKWVVADMLQLEDRRGVGGGHIADRQSRIAGERRRIRGAGRGPARAERQVGDKQAADPEHHHDPCGRREDRAATTPVPRRQRLDVAAEWADVLVAQRRPRLERLAEGLFELVVGHRRASASKAARRRPMAAWVRDFTVPAGMPSASAASATGRSHR